MDTKEYNKLLKYLYFEGYTDSYEEAEQLIEEVNDDEFDVLYEEFLLNEAVNSVVGYLVSEGFADDKEAASAILNVMSDEWLDQIMEASASSDEILRAFRQGGASKKIMAGRIAFGGDSTGLDYNHPSNVEARKKKKIEGEQKAERKKRMSQVEYK